jgi:predicted nucleic acid binding AN1-type Zn finger protein
MQLNVAVMFALPLMIRDLKNDDVTKIHDLLNQVMENFTERKEQGFSLC